MITPFKHLATNPQQRRFNKALSKARITVECSFGQLTTRWRRLQFVYSLDIKEICNIILASCTLHNFCKAENEDDFACDPVLVQEDNDICTFSPDATGSMRRHQVLSMFL
jgi:hypothetical protein